jgi:hypothetical protein
MKRCAASLNVEFVTFPGKELRQLLNLIKDDSLGALSIKLRYAVGQD